MVVVISLVAAIHVIGLLLVLLAVARAPRGYEDEDGFHRKTDDTHEAEPGSDRSHSTAGDTLEADDEAFLPDQESAGSP